MLLEELGSLGEAEAFFKWAAQHFEDTTRIDLPFTRMSNMEFKTQLSKADWRGRSSALSLVNSRLWPSNVDNFMAYIPLGRFRTDWLALRTDSNVLTPTQTDSATLDLYKDVAVNSNNILGARYDYVTRDQGKQTLLFAQLGRILSTCIGGRHSDKPLAERPWDDTGFVLALEIRESGSAGKFYMICNLTWENEWEELSDEEIYDDPRLRRLCNEEPPFTVAQIEGQGLSLLKDTWDKAYEDKEEIRLAVVSKLRPEIFETGLLENRDDRSLIAFHVNSHSEST